MNEITDIWFKTNLSLDKLPLKLGFVLEEFDFENVWEWTISTFGELKLDICRDHTKKRLQTFTNIFRIDEHKKPFPEELLNHIVTKLSLLNITPVYFGKSWVGKDDAFEFELIETIE